MRQHRPAILTFLLAGLIVVVSLTVGGAQPTEEELSLANWSSARAAEGAWWRLVAALFVHTSLWHLAGNVAALVALGAHVERRVGAARTGALLLAAGMAGNLVHALVRTDPVAGASGALFGLVAYAAIALPRAPLVDAARVRVPILAAVAAYGLGLPALDLLSGGHTAHGAHLGGALVGLAMVATWEPLRSLRRVPMGALLVLGASVHLWLWSHGAALASEGALAWGVVGLPPLAVGWASRGLWRLDAWSGARDPTEETRDEDEQRRADEGHEQTGQEPTTHVPAHPVEEHAAEDTAEDADEHVGEDAEAVPA